MVLFLSEFTPLALFSHVTASYAFLSWWFGMIFLTLSYSLSLLSLYHCIIYIFFCWFIWSMLEGGVVNINYCKSLVMTGFTCVTLRIIINLIGLVKSILILYHNKENPNLSYLGIFPHLFIIILYNFSLFCFMFQSHASIY